MLEPLFLYAGLAALPLITIDRKQERDRAAAAQWDLCQEVLSAATGGY